MNLRILATICSLLASCTQNITATASPREFEPLWNKVKELEGKNQYQAARDEVELIYKKALEMNSDDQTVKGLFELVKLTLGLHGYDKAANYLFDKKWPQSKKYKAIMYLFRANVLMTYYQSYSWEIQQREEIVSKERVELKKWTARQIFDQVHRDYHSAWKHRNLLTKIKLSAVSEYIQPGSFPRNIYSTVADFLAYSWSEFLTNSQTWTPTETNELYKVPFENLVVQKKRSSYLVSDLLSKDHPILKINTILYNHRARGFFMGGGEGKAQAVIQFYHVLFRHFSKQRQKDRIREEFSKALASYKNYPWWAYGKYVEASWLDSESKKVEARNICKKVLNKYPKSIGGSNCETLIKRIEKPDYSISSRANDREEKNTFNLTYRNLTKMYFRAYKVDLKSAMKSKQWRMREGLNIDSMEELTKHKLVKSWQVDLKETDDYLDRKVNVRQELIDKGYYLVAASSKEDFSKEQNGISYVSLNITDLYAFYTNREDSLEIGVRKGVSGKGTSAKIKLYSFDWENGAQLIHVTKASSEGWAKIPRYKYYNQFLTVEKNDDLFLSSNGIYYYGHGNSNENSVARFIYTDRSLYRPEQTVHFKIVSAKRNGGDDYKSERGRSLAVALYDANNKIVQEKIVKTNEYGTASDKFEIPKGRALGSWRVSLKDSWMGQNNIQVEEYKRPTFLSEFKAPEKEFRLNEKITLTGEAKYYFGLPLQGATVKYTVTRSPVYPWWFWWRYSYGGFNRSTSEVISQGELITDDKGEFKLIFNPEADPSMKDQKSVSYSFSVSATVTDEGGETRYASTSLNVGFVGVQGTLVKESGFFLEEEKPSFNISRTNLSGNPQAGKASVIVYKLQSPEKINERYLDKKLIEQGKVEGIWTKPHNLDREIFSWANGESVFSKEFEHDSSGNYKLEVKALNAGAYRIVYSTNDNRGETFKTEQTFIVAGDAMNLPLGSFILAKKTSVDVGEEIHIFTGTGYVNQDYYFEKYQSSKLLSRKLVSAEQNKSNIKLFKFRIKESDRGGFVFKVNFVNDLRIFDESLSVYVPWSNKRLNVKVETFRDLIRPGQKETWTLKISGPDQKSYAAEVLAYMYDRSLDQIRGHYYPSLASLYPGKSSGSHLSELQAYLGNRFIEGDRWHFKGGILNPQYGRFVQINRYGVGGLGSRGQLGFSGSNEGFSEDFDNESAVDAVSALNSTPAPALAQKAAKRERRKDNIGSGSKLSESKSGPRDEIGGRDESGQDSNLRTNFSETAFFYPHLETNKDGSVSLSFTVPDSVTTWAFYAHAHSKDFLFGNVVKQTISQKELMVRPYVPRFYREDDQGKLKVVINNASQGKSAREISGKVQLRILDLNDNNKDVSALFKIEEKEKEFKIKSGGSTTVNWSVRAPSFIGQYAFEVKADAGDLKDGELRPIPVLPSRIHLFQSKFITLKDKETKKIIIEDLKKAHGDKTLIHDSFVVTVDGQLIFTVLKALPYLVNYAYECTEQTLNRFLSTSIVHSVFDQFPSMKKMAADFVKDRKNQFEDWSKDDPNRKIGLEETPWMRQSEGGRAKNLIKVLDPKVVKSQKKNSLKKLKNLQLPSGGFPWFPGGEANLYMTLYATNGFAKAYEHKVEIPKDMVQRAIGYVVKNSLHDFCHPWSEHGTFFNYILSNFPKDYYSSHISEKKRDEILKCSWDHWKDHSPFGKAYLALTLKRKGRDEDAKTVMMAIMDSSVTKEDQGTFWAPEDYGWLWYNDRIETHAFSLRALSEIMPKDKRRDGLALWLLLNKKLNQWKSTRATAEVIYSLLHYMKSEGSLGIDEIINVDVAGENHKFVFKADEYTGEKNQIEVPKEKITSAHAETTISKETKGFAFASAMWHYSTEKMPSEARGDFLNVTRKYFKRTFQGKKYILKPIAEGEIISIGDQIEVQLSIKTKHQFEYVHLRDPRGAGFEPESQVSRYKWQLGIGYYEEIRDSATNFFISWLPQGEYNFKYRVRANMAGVFRVGPTTLQSMYAPEFGAFSSGIKLVVE